MSKKNIAVLLSGLHYSDCDNKLSTIIDYRKYSENIKNKIYGYFSNNYNIDTFICTNKSNIFINLIKTYAPIKFYVENSNNNYVKKLRVFELLINYINENDIIYDLFLLTSFDIKILNELTNIDLNKLNIINILNSNLKIDKDLLIFPIKYLSNILSIFKNNVDFINKLENESYLNITTKKNIAILLYGPHYSNNINFNKYTQNIKNKIYGNFINNYNIDTFICTNKSVIFTELLNAYSPITFYIEDNNNLRKNKVFDILNNYIINNKKKILFNFTYTF